MKQLEKRCRTLEMEVTKLKASEASLKDLLGKLHGDSEVLGFERAELAAYAKKVHIIVS